MRKKVVVAMLLPVKNHIYPVFLHQSSRLGGETSNLSYVGQIGRIGQLWSYVRRIGRVGQFMGPDDNYWLLESRETVSLEGELQPQLYPTTLGTLLCCSRDEYIR